MYYRDFIQHGEITFERDESYLSHHGIRGMKWGIRRYQNPDGSLTEAGKKRYYRKDGTLKTKYAQQKYGELNSEYFNKGLEFEKKFDKTEEGKRLLKKMRDAYDKYEKASLYNDYSKEGDEKEERLAKEFDKAENAYLKTLYTKQVNELTKNYSDAELSALATYGPWGQFVREDLPRQESIQRLILEYNLHKM